MLDAHYGAAHFVFTNFPRRIQMIFKPTRELEMDTESFSVVAFQELVHYLWSKKKQTEFCELCVSRTSDLEIHSKIPLFKPAEHLHRVKWSLGVSLDDMKCYYY